MKVHEIGKVHAGPFNYDNLPKSGNFMIVLYFLNDISSDLLGYIHHGRFQ